MLADLESELAWIMSNVGLRTRRRLIIPTKD